jgi:hypothetical protein
VPKCSTPLRHDEMSRLPAGRPPRPILAPRPAPHSHRPRQSWVVPCGIAVCVLLVALVVPGRPAAAALLRLRCTNPASGASWPVVVDLDRSRVDSLQATITEQSISWHDPKQGFFDLDRATGRLEFRNASSTGGYFLHYTCRLE